MRQCVLAALGAILLAGCDGCGAGIVESRLDGGALVKSDAATVPSGADAATQADSDAGSAPRDAAFVGEDAALPVSGPDASAQPPAIRRVGPTFEIPTVAGGKRQADVAYDPIHDVYLVVHGQGPVGGAFVTADGVPTLAPFQIPETADWSQTPRVTWFPAAQALLVTWHDTRTDPNHPHVRARLVAYDPSGVKMLSASVAVSTVGSYQEIAPAAGCAPLAAECLVTWMQGGPLYAQRLDGAGSPVGSAITLSATDWNADPAVAFGDADEFFVVHTFAGASNAVYGHRVQVGTGAVVGSALTLVEGSYPTVAPYVAHAPWDPTRHRFLASWWQPSLYGRFVAADYSLQSPFALVPGCGAYDGFAIAFNKTADAYATVMHGGDSEDWAAAIGADGVSGPAVAATQSPAGTNGNFNPRIAAHGTRREWLMVSVRDFNTVVGQRLTLP